jgi:hypothetical protein
MGGIVSVSLAQAFVENGGFVWSKRFDGAPCLAVSHGVAWRRIEGGTFGGLAHERWTLEP